MRKRNLALLAAGIAFVGWLALAPATAWLVTGQEPVRADLLVVLGGGSGERVATGLELYRAGFAPRLMITDRFGYPDLAYRRLQREGVPARALAAPLRPSSSTYEDALAIGQVVSRDKLASILVVTSPYHCRRARLILGRVLAPLGVRVTVTPSKTLYMDLGSWWLERQGWITVPAEFPKLLWAWATVADVATFGRPQ